MKKTPNIPINEIVDSLEDLSQRKENGTMFIYVDESHKFAQIAFRNGQIVFILYGQKRNKAALKELAMIKKARCRFKQGLCSPVTDPLPRVSEILAILRGTNRVIKNRTPGYENDPFEIFEKYLADYIGPAASICVDEQRKNTNMRSVIDLLAKEIPSADEAKEFREKVKFIL